jgi:hypothetical protein
LPDGAQLARPSKIRNGAAHWPMKSDLAMGNNDRYESKDYLKDFTKLAAIID